MIVVKKFPITMLLLATRRKEIKEKNRVTPLNPKEALLRESSLFHRCRIP
jgi:hypothetical protein